MRRQSLPKGSSQPYADSILVAYEEVLALLASSP